MAAEASAPAPAIILVEPQLAENIGMAARAMLNFGLTDLRLVNPRPDWPSARAIAASSGADRVIEAARLYRSLDAATADLRRVFATTGRPRDMVKRVVTPRQAIGEIRAQADVATGILFGPERSGLVNDDVAGAEAVIAAPLNPDFSSLNLAQAVLLIGYEWFLAADQTPPDALRGPGPGGAGEAAPATRQHLQSFLDRLEVELVAAGFLRFPHMRPAMVENIRALFARATPTDQEVRMLHGMLSELVARRLAPSAADGAVEAGGEGRGG